MKKKSNSKKITTNKVGTYASDYSKYGDKKTTSEASKAMDAGVRKGLGMK